MNLRQHIINEAAFKEDDAQKQSILQQATNYPVSTYTVRRGADTSDQRALRGRVTKAPEELWNDLGIAGMKSGEVLAENLKSVIDGLLKGKLNNHFSALFGNTMYVRNGKKLGVLVPIQGDASGSTALKNLAFYLWSTIIAANSIGGILKNVSRRYLRIEAVSGKSQFLIYMSRSKWDQVS